VARIIVFRGREKEQTCQLNKRRMLIGRGDDADIRVDNPLVSRAHAVVRFGRSGWQVEDLESPNGLYLNGKRTKVASLEVGDRIELGRHVLIFEGTGESEFDVETQNHSYHSEGSATEATAILKPMDVEELHRRVRSRMKMHLVMVWDQQRKEIFLDKDRYLIGYSNACNIRLPGSSLLGKEVARLSREGETYRLEALTAMNKVRINGKRAEFQALVDGDRIHIRNVTIQFHQDVGRKKNDHEE
jgi:hypothetical protein